MLAGLTFLTLTLLSVVRSQHRLATGGLDNEGVPTAHCPLNECNM